MVKGATPIKITKSDLENFEQEIKVDFLAGKIRHPVHFSKGNEDQVVEIFKNIKPDDWVFSTHRSHLHALLKGIPKEWIKEQIYHGNSMHLINKDFKFFASAIVCGSVPIAVGVAMAIKRRKETNHVWVFVGDMAGSTGIFYENAKYARRNELPITFVIEDNGLSTNTPTQEAWGISRRYKDNIVHYKYVRDCPHINCDVHVEFH